MSKLEYDLENFGRLCHLHDKVAKLEQALAEKDRELEQLKRAYHQEIARHKDTIHDLIVRQAADSSAYQQLMEKAVWFARQLGVERVSGGLSYIEYPEKVQDFLASPEVQAWKEQP